MENSTNKQPDVLVKYVIKEMSFPVDGYKYNVQVWTSLDGNDYWYCGIGRFCKTLEECQEYIRRYDSER